MTKFVALTALVFAHFAVMVGNYWFTFGLWPRSWWSFFLFAWAFIIVSLMMDKVRKE